MTTYSRDTIDALDELAVTFLRHNQTVAYHHIRAVVHRQGWHLSGCAGGIRYEGNGWDEAPDTMRAISCHCPIPQDAIPEFHVHGCPIRDESEGKEEK